MDHFTKNNYMTKKYYLTAIDQPNVVAMYILGHYYQFIEKTYGQMKNYYLMAIEFNDTASMNNLGYYFHRIEKNYNLAEQYYLMAIKENDAIAMHNPRISTEEILSHGHQFQWQGWSRSPLPSSV